MFKNPFKKQSLKINTNFDRVYCISYCRNIEKQNNIRKVMNYLGIDFTFIYGADYSNLKILKHKDFKFFNSESDDKWKSDELFQNYTHFIGASYDHYTAVIHAYESGANSVLILEDDCTFINDTSYIQWAFNNYPKDADLIKFGYVSRKSLKTFKCEGIDLDKSHQFIKVPDDQYNIAFAGSQLYGIYNRKTMEKYIDLQKNNFTCVDGVPGLIKDSIQYGLIQPLGIDYWGNWQDLHNNYSDIYTLFRKPYEDKF